jgi:hypothetical protein
MSRPDIARAFHAARAAAALALGLFCGVAHAAVYHCTSANGQTLFTDNACPEGYTTTAVVADPALPSALPDQPYAPAVTGEREPSRDRATDAELARLKAEAENARLRSELDQERLRAIDRKLDALLETTPVYGAVGVLPLGVAPKPFPLCKGRKGERAWVGCRPDRKDRNVRVVPSDGPSCGIVGCTPGIAPGVDDGRARRVR